jgi:predicted RNase H-like HicB family nuclease
MQFDVVVRRDEDDYYVAIVPELHGCHTQAKSLGDLIELNQRGHLLYLETESSNVKPCGSASR